MEIIKHQEILNLVKEYFPDFTGGIGNIRYQPTDKSLYITRRSNNSINEEDILLDLIKFEQISNPITLYHYRKSEYIEDIINGITRVDSLNKYLDSGDKNELSIGISLFNSTLIEGDFNFNLFKGEHYIFCLTDKPNSEYHFNEFGNACIEFKFTPKVNSNLIKFYKVKYLKELTNFIDLKESLKNRFGINLKLKFGTTISPFIKSNKYTAECEFRMLFNVYYEQILKHSTIDMSELDFLKEIKRFPNYIEMPLNNSLFKLSVENIWYN
jgi:hypothetical protein